MKTNRIANENREEIVKAIKSFFKEEYKTEVKVHNIVGNVDGATVMVESIGEPHFYTYAVIPINKKIEEIYSDKVFSQQGQVESVIIAGLYGLIKKEEFQNLTNLIEDLNEKYNLTGLNEEAIPIGANRFSNQYYFVSIGDLNSFNHVLKEYIEDPNRSQEEWLELMNVQNIDFKKMIIAIKLYMASSNVDPNKKALDELIQAIESSNNIPNGNYQLILNDNLIHKEDANGYKENSLEKIDLLKK
ncbi:DUF1672 family protein [Gracilibacillus kekensis]|uniref:DUF1672 family protein n=1 Tax=Gracilibacillus kekensis TaxID=1027249 RepID=UPI001FCCD48C|nr:DUF1672 family protein [Gracilibacillus kekensis]